MSSAASPYGDIIYLYSRADALADGVLIEADPQLCHEAGIRIPVAISDHLWGIINPDNLDEMIGQDLTGRLWDLLYMFRVAASDPKNHGKDRLTYKVVFLTKCHKTPCRLQTFEVLAVCGPGDSGEPVLTLMLPEDD